MVMKQNPRVIRIKLHFFFLLNGTFKMFFIAKSRESNGLFILADGRVLWGGEQSQKEGEKLKMRM